ncbi:hypothetical protein HY29_05940 [Hyphomonas beringensis]|uniref:Uncharacterized protein n=1 Tax=Hyphomonas beringensis TaxID=1280946 RepID=A0A062U5I2_9PROT|nr:hypothetical protein [Hyphomonas beringensis]KCZ51405.1 hypothetical protein HY29_05940 [Hyphomonas beringensis]
MVVNRVKGIFRKRPTNASPPPPPPPDVTIIQADDVRPPDRTLDSLNRWLTLAINVAILVALIMLIIELRKNTDLLEASQQAPAASPAISDSTPE